MKIGNNEKLQITKYVLTKPYQFEARIEEIDFISKGYALVEVLETSVCTADLRYFSGRRPQDVLNKKLPMVLLHEGIGRVLKINDNSDIKPEDYVVFVPVIPCDFDDSICKACEDIPDSENYCKRVRFISSDCDGLCGTHMLHPAACLEKIPDDIDLRAAVLSEILTVAYEAFTKFDSINTEKDDKIVILGTGVMAYLLVLVLSYVFNIEKEALVVVGRKNKKMELLNDICIQKFKNSLDEISNLNADIIFECVGGRGSESSINCAIRNIKAAGTIVLLGVSDDRIPISTRPILEKNIRIMGISRSPKEHYKKILKALENKELSERVKAIVNKEFICSDIEGVFEAFKCFEEEKEKGKVVCRFNL